MVPKTAERNKDTPGAKGKEAGQGGQKLWCSPAERIFFNVGGYTVFLGGEEPTFGDSAVLEYSLLCPCWTLKRGKVLGSDPLHL